MKSKEFNLVMSALNDEHQGLKEINKLRMYIKLDKAIKNNHKIIDIDIKKINDAIKQEYKENSEKIFDLSIDKILYEIFNNKVLSCVVFIGHYRGTSRLLHTVGIILLTSLPAEFFYRLFNFNEYENYPTILVLNYNIGVLKTWEFVDVKDRDKFAYRNRKEIVYELKPIKDVFHTLHNLKQKYMFRVLEKEIQKMDVVNKL